MTSENLHRELISYMKKYAFSDNLLFLLHGKNDYIKEMNDLEKTYKIFGEWDFFGKLLVNIKAIEELILEKFKGGLTLKTHYLIIDTLESLNEFEEILKRNSQREEIIKRKEDKELKEKIASSLKKEYKGSEKMIELIFNILSESKNLKDKELLDKMTEVKKYVNKITNLNTLFGKGKNFYNELKKNTIGGNKNYE